MFVPRLLAAPSRFSYLLTFAVLFFSQAANAQDLARLIEADFKKNLPRILSLTANNDPSIILGPEGNSKTKFATNLQLIDGSSHSINFDFDKRVHYKVQVPYTDKTKQAPLYNFLLQVSKQHLTSKAYATTSGIYKDLRHFRWALRQQLGGEWYNTEVSLTESTEKISTTQFHMVNFEVYTKPLTYPLRTGEATIARKAIQPAELLQVLGSNIPNRFRKLAMFSTDVDSTEFKPYLQLAPFISGNTEDHRIYNTNNLYHNQSLTYVATNYYPFEAKDVEETLLSVVTSFSAALKNEPRIRRYEAGDYYEWTIDSLSAAITVEYQKKSQDWPARLVFIYKVLNKDLAIAGFNKKLLAATAGDADAMNEVGVAYYTGNGVTKDLDKAAHYFTKAAELGNGKAMVNTGMVYLNGFGVGKNEKKGLKWYTKAAEKKVPDAFYKLGYVYLDGQGVNKDMAKAMEWFQLAADSNHKAALTKLGSLTWSEYKNRPKALHYLLKGVQLGDGYAATTIGSIYQDEGKGDSALLWYDKAIGLNNSFAYGYIGDLHRANKNQEGAEQAYRNGAAAKNAYCMRRLGILYEYGTPSLRQDKDQAKYWYEQAAKAGDTVAQGYVKTMNDAARPKVYYDEDNL